MSNIVAGSLVYSGRGGVANATLYDVNSPVAFSTGPSLHLLRYLNYGQESVNSADSSGRQFVAIIPEVDAETDSSVVFYTRTKIGMRQDSRFNLPGARGVCMSGDGNYTAVTKSGTTLVIYKNSRDLVQQTDNWVELSSFAIQHGSLPSLSYSSDGATLLLGGDLLTYVTVYVRSGNSYAVSQQIESPDSDVKFGVLNRISADGNTCIISTEHASNGNKLYIYRKNSSGQFILVKTILSDDLGVSSQFIRDVSLSTDGTTLGVIYAGDSIGNLYSVLTSIDNWTSYVISVNGVAIAGYQSSSAADRIVFSPSTRLMCITNNTFGATSLTIYTCNSIDNRWVYSQRCQVEDQYVAPTILNVTLHDDGSILYGVASTNLELLEVQWNFNMLLPYNVPYKYQTSAATSGTVTILSNITHLILTGVASTLTVQLASDNVPGRRLYIDVRGSVTALNVLDSSGGTPYRWTNGNGASSGYFLEFMYADSQYVYIG